MRVPLIIALLCAAVSSFAQWNLNGATSGNIYYTGGNVGIGTADPKYPLSVRGMINSEANGDYYGAWFGGESRTNKPSINVGAWWNNKGSIYWNLNKMHFQTQISDTEIFENNLVLDQGRAGIGTSSPQYRLDVADHMRIQGDTPYLIFGRWNDNFNASVYSYATSYANDNVAFAINNTFNNSFPTSTFGSARIRLYTANTSPYASISFETRPPNDVYFTRMAITSEGNVGIGTTSPSQKLEVTGVIQSSNEGIKIGPSNTAIASDGLSLYLKSGGNTYLNTNSNAYITNSGGASFSGNVGIGTTNTPQQFSLTGGIGFANQNAFDKKLYSPSDGLLEWMTHNAAGDHAFAVSHQGEKMVYLNSLGNSYLIGGNLGIGTTTPDAKLTVAGDIHSREVKVTVSAGTGPDYVFEPTYNLSSLTEIETYIKANKHLPEVPSAKEMEANGVNLSEMNMLLLRKIEELTLHLIDQNKLIDKLNASQTSADASAKKVEELTLYLIDHKSELDKLKLENKLLLERVNNIENR